MDGARDAFVGREAEIALLRQAAADARAGRGGVVLVSGPAGIGKSRLVEEALAGVRPVVWGRCVAEDGAPPLWPWLRALARLPATATTGAGTGIAGGAVRGAAAGGDAEAGGQAGARFLRIASLTDALIRAAGDAGGLVVVVEDVHDADETSQAMLRHVAVEAAGSHLLVVATHRAGGPVLTAVVAEVARARAARTLVLPPLTRAEVARLLSGLPGGHAAAGSVHERTGGSPLLVSAVARAMKASHGDAGGGGTVPADLPVLVLGMLAGLDPDVRRTARAAAVLGDDLNAPANLNADPDADPDASPDRDRDRDRDRAPDAGLDGDLDVDLLAEVAGVPPSAVPGHLDALASAGLLAWSRGRRAVHALVREGIAAQDPAAGAPAAERDGAALERRAGADPAQAARIAAHWRRAGGDEEALRALVRWARAAAAHALRAPAGPEAARLSREALNALDRLGPPPDERAGLLVELARAEVAAGEVRPAVAHCEEAAGLAALAGRADLLAAAALVVGGAGDPAVGRKVAALCDRALAALEEPGAVPSPEAVRARLVARRTYLDVETGRAEDAARASKLALRRAEECGDPFALLDAVQARAAVLVHPDDAAERRRLGDLAIRTGLRSGRPVAAVRGHLWRVDAAYQAADLAAADEGVAAIGELAAATRLPGARWYHLRAAAARAALAGRLEEARALSGEAGDLARRMEDRVAAAVSVMFAGVLGVVRGDPGELPRRHRDVLAALPRTPLTEAARCLFLHLEGDRDEARSRYEHLRPSLREPVTGVRSLGVLQYLTELVEAFDDAEAAGWAYALWTPWREAGGLPGAADSMCGGATARAAGRMAAVMGRLDDAVVTLRAAAEVNLRLDARPWLAHTWADLARVLLRRSREGGGADDRAEAAALARRARAEAVRLALPGPVARADAVLAALDADRRDPLTPREREVAALVARALSNRQIADLLVLSERTVESHVRNVLAKLGVSNRTELVARLLRTGTGQDGEAGISSPER
ncbi:AAA family ATPase [Microbispora corallina]|uniref:LuxR family transcriptional regulator n=1 Tax=Microbispora corallina TaxID=83302 RepID=UPI0031D46BF1